MRILFLFLKILVGIVALVLFLLVGTVVVLNTDSFQNKMMGYATETLSERLGTSVTLDHIYVNIFGQGIELNGLKVKDQQQRDMFELNKLLVRMDLMALRRNEVKIRQAEIAGVKALLVKNDSDSIANYQFLIDSIRHMTPAKTKEKKVEKKGKKQFTLDAHKITIDDVSVRFNDKDFKIGHLHLKNKDGKYDVELGDAFAQITAKTKKGPLDCTLILDNVHFYEKSGNRFLDIDSLRFKTCNHKPRRNHGRPKRGYFDSKNLDVCANFHFSLDLLEKDSVRATLIKGEAADRVAGLDFRDIRFGVAGNKKVLNLTNVTIQQGASTNIHFGVAVVNLPSKKEGREFSYFTSEIRGSTLLRDISRPFAPVLKKFTLPLHLRTRMTGTKNDMYFHGVQVYTSDKRVMIGATGQITNLKDKHRMKVYFKVHKMYAMKGSAEKIINQFAVKKLMMEPLDNLGNIRFVGDFSIPWKREEFRGTLNTEVGALNFSFALDEINKYVTGYAQTDSLELGKAMGMKDMGKIVAKSEFRVDISKVRTAQMRKKLGGKLPICTVKADVKEAKVKGMTIRNLTADIVSNGAVAEGKVVVKGKYMDVLCSFTFTNTAEMQKTKIKPGLRFHKLSEEDRKAKEEQKLKKQQAKEERKRQKAEEKEAARIRKDTEKAIKAELKAQKKAEKKAQKDSLKQAKKAEKELRKKQKAEAKALLKAQKENAQD